MMDDSQSWNESLLMGTSLEWQQMMQHSDHDAKRQWPQEVLPGEWLSGDINNGGILCQKYCLRWAILTAHCTATLPSK